MRNSTISRSISLKVGQIREIGRYEDPNWRGLSTLWTGMMLA